MINTVFERAMAKTPYPAKPPAHKPGPGHPIPLKVEGSGGLSRSIDETAI
jgi:hypothetical protein